MTLFRRMAPSIVALLVFGTVQQAGAQQTLMLDNGDRLTGTLTNIKDDSWTFNHAGGELKVPAASVTGFTAPDPIGIRLVDGAIMAVSIAMVGDRLQLQAQDGSTRTAVPGELAAVGDPADLEALVPVQVGYFSPLNRFWGATTSLGFSNKSGNSRSRGISASIELRRTSPKDRLTFKAGLNREEAGMDGGGLETTVEKYYGSLRADVFFGPKFFIFGVTGQERDTFQDIDLRSNYNAGFGYQVIANPATDLRVFASGGARVERFTSGGSNTTGVFGSGAGFRQALGPAVLDWSVDWAPSVDDIEDFRFLSQTSLTTTIYKGLGFRVAIRNEINNSPPAGIKKHDMLVETGLTYAVGR